jgi:hypothetical protein
MKDGAGPLGLDSMLKQVLRHNPSFIGRHLQWMIILR